MLHKLGYHPTAVSQRLQCRRAVLPLLLLATLAWAWSFSFRSNSSGIHSDQFWHLGSHHLRVELTQGDIIITDRVIQFVGSNEDWETAFPGGKIRRERQYRSNGSPYHEYQIRIELLLIGNVLIILLWFQSWCRGRRAQA